MTGEEIDELERLQKTWLDAHERGDEAAAGEAFAAFKKGVFAKCTVLVTAARKGHVLARYVEELRERHARIAGKLSEVVALLGQ